MQLRRFLAAAAVVLPLGAVVAIGGPASAAGTPKGAGTITCTIGGDATFTPALTSDGTPGYKHEVIHFNLSASGCSGPGSDTPQPNPTSATITTKPIKVKDIGKGKSKVAGACGNSEFNPTITLKSVEVWAGATVMDTRTVIGPMSGNGVGGLAGTGTAKKSYAGTASATLTLTSASDEQIQQVCKSGGSGSISEFEFEFDPTTSTMTVG